MVWYGGMKRQDKVKRYSLTNVLASASASASAPAYDSTLLWSSGLSGGTILYVVMFEVLQREKGRDVPGLLQVTWPLFLLFFSILPPSLPLIFFLLQLLGILFGFLTMLLIQLYGRSSSYFQGALGKKLLLLGNFSIMYFESVTPHPWLRSSQSDQVLTLKCDMCQIISDLECDNTHLSFFAKREGGELFNKKNRSEKPSNKSKDDGVWCFGKLFVYFSSSN